jgi:hypothetical protein
MKQEHPTAADRHLPLPTHDGPDLPGYWQLRSTFFGVPVTLEWADGGGYVPSLLLVRLNGSLVNVGEAMLV